MIGGLYFFAETKLWLLLWSGCDFMGLDSLKWLEETIRTIEDLDKMARFWRTSP